MNHMLTNNLPRENMTEDTAFSTSTRKSHASRILMHKHTTSINTALYRTAHAVQQRLTQLFSQRLLKTQGDKTAEEASSEEMISRNETCTSVPISGSHLSEEYINAAHPLNHYLHVAAHLIFSTPILVLSIVPLFVMGSCYILAIILLIYQKTLKPNTDYSSPSWDNARAITSYLLIGIGKMLHGYEVHGMENLPNGPGLIVYYHGAIPIDYGFFLANHFFLKRKLCYSVADHFLFNLPGFQTLLRIMNFTQGTKEECLNILKEGNLLGISPGGVREAHFSDETYKLVWGNRKGFAQLAIDAEVAIIPMFTENIRDGYRTLGKIWPMRWLYEWTRWPVVPLYGMFPVKLCTYIGQPIAYDPNVTADELAKKTKIAIEALINKHQKIPGSVLRALIERFHKCQKQD